MAHYKRGRMSLYEVMSRARLKPGFGRTLEKIREQRGVESPPPSEETPPVLENAPVENAPAAENVTESMPSNTVQWWRKPKLVQLNAGRLEFSIPYQLAIAIVLGLILVTLVAFRLGQYSYVGQDKSADVPVVKPLANPPKPQGQTPSSRTETPRISKDVTPNTGTGVPAQTTGKNIIVIVEYKARADLVPVQAHFAENGIETEIITEGGRYFLVTKNRYDNPNTPGTDGYVIKQKIIDVGAKYRGKAPAGYETFAPNFFKDAYGKKAE